MLLSSRSGVCLEKEKGERGRSRLRLAAPIGNLQYTLQYVTLAFSVPFTSSHDSLFTLLFMVLVVYYECYFNDSIAVVLLYHRRMDGKRIANTKQPVPVIFNPARLNITT